MPTGFVADGPEGGAVEVRTLLYRMPSIAAAPQESNTQALKLGVLTLYPQLDGTARMTRSLIEGHLWQLQGFFETEEPRPWSEWRVP